MNASGIACLVPVFQLQNYLYESMSFNIIIVEDDIILRESYLCLIEKEGFSVTGVGSAREFYKCLDQVCFDVAVIDIGLPDQSGYVLAEYVRNNTDLGIIILTAQSGIEQRLQGYSAGADIFLVKPIHMAELVAAITNLAKRHTERTPQPASSVDTWLLCHANRRLVSPEGVEIRLTGKEFDFILLLAEAGGQVIKRRQIISSLKYPEDEYDGRAIDSLLLRLRRKIIEQTGKESPIQNAHSVGYCFSSHISIC